MPVVAKNPADIVAMLHAAVGRYHPELREHEITWTVLLARAVEPKAPKRGKKGAPPPPPKPPAPPVLDRGVPAPATVKFPSEEQRLSGATCAILKVDGDAWDLLLPEERWALLDHYSGLAEIVLDAETAEPVVLKDGRAKLRRRRYDWQTGILADVVSRHGEHALEVIALRRASREVDRLARDARPQPGMDDGEADDGNSYSVTVSAGGESVTLNGEQFEAARERLAEFAAGGLAAGQPGDVG